MRRYGLPLAFTKERSQSRDGSSDDDNIVFDGTPYLERHHIPGKILVRIEVLNGDSFDNRSSKREDAESEREAQGSFGANGHLKGV